MRLFDELCREMDEVTEEVDAFDRANQIVDAILDNHTEGGFGEFESVNLHGSRQALINTIVHLC